MPLGVVVFSNHSRQDNYRLTTRNLPGGNRRLVIHVVVTWVNLLHVFFLEHSFPPSHLPFVLCFAMLTMYMWRHRFIETILGGWYVAICGREHQLIHSREGMMMVSTQHGKSIIKLVQLSVWAGNKQRLQWLGRKHCGGSNRYMRE